MLGFCCGCKDCPETELVVTNRVVKPKAVLVDNDSDGHDPGAVDELSAPIVVDLHRRTGDKPGSVPPNTAKNALQLAIAEQKRFESISASHQARLHELGLPMPPSPPVPKGFAEEADAAEVGANFTEEKRSVLRSMATTVAAELCNEVDHELRISQAEAHFACSGSTSLAMLWGRFFHASDNAAFRSVAMEVSPHPGGDALHFVANLKRRSSQQRFGFECTEAMVDPGVLLVTGVERGGCVEAWNDHCAQLNLPWKRVHLCAAILAVNGVSGNSKRMRQELAHNMQAVLVACNPPALHDAVTLLRAVRAAAPPPAGRPFWVRAQRRTSGALDHVFAGVPEEPAPSHARVQGSPGPSSARTSIPSTPRDYPEEEDRAEGGNEISSC